jgi:hemerythrin-like domain-containing protein
MVRRSYFRVTRNHFSRTDNFGSRFSYSEESVMTHHQPLKRHPGLQTLSRDHHEGLLLAVRLQQGPKALLRLWSHDPVWQADYVIRFYREHLAGHFEEEETMLFPVVSGYLGKNHPMITRLFTEHTAMREMINRLSTTDPARLTAMLTEFGQLLEQHIRTEERELFIMCEKLFNDEDWKTITRLLGGTKANHQQAELE